MGLTSNGMDFINVNKKYDFDNLSNDNIVFLIKEKIQKEKDKIVQSWTDAGIRVEKARWGRHHIIRGKQKVEIGKEINASKLTLSQAEKYLGNSSTKKKGNHLKNEFRTSSTR